MVSYSHVTLWVWSPEQGQDGRSELVGWGWDETEWVVRVLEVVDCRLEESYRIATL